VSYPDPGNNQDPPHPRSYDLAPEFAQPPPAPQYAPPVYQPAPAAYLGPPAPKKKRRGWLIALSVAGVLAIGCCGVGLAVAAPILREYPATISVPPDLAGMAKQQNAETDRLGQSLGDELKKTANVDSAVAGLYAGAGDQQHPVLVLGASGLLLSPANEVDSAFKGMGTAGLSVSNVAPYDAGSLGGIVKCGSGKVPGTSLVVCAWGDHGSLGMAIFYNRPIAESADLFLKVREGMLSRG
jgi:hypothetical protein